MSVFANDNTDKSVNALLDPFATISYTGILSEKYFKIIKEIFGKFMYPGMVSIPVNYNGIKYKIKMPGKIQVHNKIFYGIRHFTPQFFPIIFTNSEKQHIFCFGTDVMQFKESEEVYVLSYYRNGIIYFSIVLINNDHVYVVNINDDSDDEIQYYKLDGKTKNGMQEYLSDLYSYEDLLKIFKNANIIGMYKEKKRGTSFANLVKQVIDECISSPSQITSKLSGRHLTSEPLTAKFNLPELKVSPMPNKIRENSEKTGKLIKYSIDAERYREKLNDCEEFFVFISPKVTGELAEFLWWYAKIEKNNERLGDYQVSYYYYDAETVAALENLCTHHVQYMNYLKLNEAIDAGLIPCYISNRRFETLEEARAEVEAYYNNPETIKATKGYETALIRSLKRIRMYEKHLNSF